MPIQFDQTTAGVVTLQAPASGSYTLQLPSGNGSSNQYLVSDGTGGLSWADLTGLQNITPALNTASPNDTVNVSSLSATGGTTNVFFALTTSTNYEGVQAQVADSTAAGGNARGANSVDFQMGRSAASQVVSAADSAIAGGYANTVSERFSAIGGGSNNTVSSFYSAIVGGDSNSTATLGTVIIGGRGNTIASGCTGSIILGGRANTVDQTYQAILGGYGGSTNGTMGMTVYPTANPLGLSSSNALIGAGTATYGTYDYPGLGSDQTINYQNGTTPTTITVNNNINMRVNSVYYFEVYTKEYIGYYPAYASHYAYCLLRMGASAATNTKIYGTKNVIYQSNYNTMYPTFAASTGYGVFAIYFYQYSQHIGTANSFVDFVYLQY